MCVSLCPRCAYMHEMRQGSTYTCAPRSLFSKLLHARLSAQICTCDGRPEALPARELNAVLPPLGCLPGVNVLFGSGIDTLFSRYFFLFWFLLWSVFHSLNSHCFCRGNHLLGCERGERGRDKEGESSKIRSKRERNRRERKQVKHVGWK